MSNVISLFPMSRTSLQWLPLTEPALVGLVDHENMYFPLKLYTLHLKIFDTCLFPKNIIDVT